MVRVGSDHMINKAGELRDSKTKFTFETPNPYVSGGAFKLLPEIQQFKPNFIGAVGMDVGASTVVLQMYYHIMESRKFMQSMLVMGNFTLRLEIILGLFVWRK